MERETIIYKGYEITTYYDQYAQSPREDGDMLGIIAYKHNKYVLGEEEIDDPIDWLEFMTGQEEKGIYNNERLAELESIFFDMYYALPLYLYDHSGITISTSSFGCRWDSGKVGYIYTTKERIKLLGAPEDRIVSGLEGEIKEFNSYLTGEVYGYDSEAGGCWGFIDDDGYEYMIEQAKAEIDHLIEGKKRERNKQLKTLIINKVPLAIRQTKLQTV